MTASASGGWFRPDLPLHRHHSVEMTDLYDAGKEIDFQKARARLEELTKPQEAKKTAKT